MKELHYGMPLSHRRDKAPSVDLFSAEQLDKHWDGWLPTFERAAEWNDWTVVERLLQLAGHLRGTARQEFFLLTPDEKSTLIKAKSSMKHRLDIGSKAFKTSGIPHKKQSQITY